jgi:hypothetical protein
VDTVKKSVPVTQAILGRHRKNDKKIWDKRITDLAIANSNALRSVILCESSFSCPQSSCHFRRLPDLSIMRIHADKANFLCGFAALRER